MFPKTVLVVGANRGMGLEFVKQILASLTPPAILFATCRDPSKAKELDSILSTAKSTQSHVLKCELCSEQDIEAAAQTVTKVCGDNGLNLIINNAGMTEWILKLEDCNMKNIIEHYQMNAVYPVLFTKCLLPALRTAANKQGGNDLSWSRAAVVMISSLTSSISLAWAPPIFNGVLGFYPYRAAKCAVNMYARCMAQDLRKDNIMVLPLHPGWVKTDMGGDEAEISVEESVSGMLKVMASAGDKHNGVVYMWKGDIMPW